MTITLDELLKGKAYKRGNSLYPETAEIVEPYLEYVQDYIDDYRIQVTKPTDLAVDITENNDAEEVTEYNLYSRVLVEGMLKPEYQLTIGDNDRYQKTISFLYALDTQNPIAKVYSGYLRQVCMNLSVFNPSAIVTKHFNDADFNNIYNNIPIFINRIEGEKKEYEDALNFMGNTEYTMQEIPVVLGTLAKNCIAKISGMSTAYNNMVKMLYSNQDVNGVKNIYYNREGKYTPYDLYQALTATISHKTDMTKRADAVLKAYRLFSSN